jgi:PKHD-type hydroxylase
MKYKYYYYNNVLSEIEREEIIINSSSCKKLIDVPAKDANNVSIKKTETSACLIKDIDGRLDGILDLIRNTNEDVFGYDLFARNPSSFNINRYKNNKNEYPYHIDGQELGSTSDIKLTAILNLSENKYEGGEFQIFTGEDRTVTEINSPGDLLIFPSNIYHRVLPVTSGERITLSMWFSGPNYK